MIKYIANQDVVKKKIGNNHALFAPKTNFIIELNETSFLLFNSLLDHPSNQQDLVSLLKSIYSVNKKTATQDVNDFLKEMLEVGLITTIKS